MLIKRVMCLTSLVLVCISAVLQALYVLYPARVCLTEFAAAHTIGWSAPAWEAGGESGRS